VGAVRSEDLLQHTLGIRKHVVVPEADHAPALLHQVSVANGIARRLSVLTTIDFDNQLAFDAREVGEIGRYRMLPTKRPTVEPMIAKSNP
jgi:hypothetical protein